MGCQDGADPGSGAREDRSKVFELRERILQLAGHGCSPEEEKSHTELMEDLNVCKRDTLVELCHSFDIAGSRSNRKEKLVSFLMKFLKNNCSRIDVAIPVKVTELREQILQLAGDPCQEENEKSRTEIVERLNVCKRDTLIELCRSFDIIGSRANRKEELISFLMKFVNEHSTAIDATNSDKKIKKRRRVKEEEFFSSGRPLKKNKQEGTSLENQDEEEANVSQTVENKRHYSECDGRNNRYQCADINGKFPNEQGNLESTVVTTAEVNSTDMKDSKTKNSSVTKKRTTPESDHKVKSCGKKGLKGDVNPQKQATKPSRNELREAIVLILDSADFATMTFGDVVKEVDKYFGKDLFERKPVIRSLIEEELFRLSEEAEKRELEEEEVAEAKARAEQSTKEMAQAQTIKTGIDKGNKHIVGQNYKTKDCVNGNGKDNKGWSSITRNNSDAAEGLQNSKVDSDTKKGDNEPPTGGKCEKVSSSVNNYVDIQGSENGEVAIVNVENNNVDIPEGSKDDRTKEEHDDTECGGTEGGGRSENGGNNAGNMNGSGAEECRSHADAEHVKHAGNGKAMEASNVAIHSDNDGKEKEGNIDAEQSPTDSGGDGKAEGAEHNAKIAKSKVDVVSGKNGATENG